MKQVLFTPHILIIGLLLAALSPAASATETQKENSEMTVSKGKQVSIEYTLTLGDKDVIDTNVGGTPLSFVQGNNQIITGLEKALEGMTVGQSKKVEVAPEEAYGPVFPEAQITIQAAQLPEEARKVGAEVQGKDPQGRVMRGLVTAVANETATVDFNHPLAGKTLHFDVKIHSVQAQ